VTESTTRAYPTGLTKRQRQVVDVVRYRNAPPGSPCYVLPGEHGTSELYVPVLYGETPSGPLHERLWRVTSATIKRTVETQAVAIGPAQLSDDLRGLPTGRIVAPLTIGDWHAPSPVVDRG
jgi:hypothetical protein